MPWPTIPEKANIIGTKWRRREPVEPDDGFNNATITGVFDASEAGLELVITPAVFGTPESCTVEAFATEYTRADGPGPAPDFARTLRDRLARIAAGS
jgi:hypothetical protein